MAFSTITGALHEVYADRRFLALAVLAVPVFAGLLIWATSIPGQSLESWLFSAPFTTKFLVAFASIVLSATLSVQAYTWMHYRFAQKRHAAGGLAGLASTLVATACCSPLLLPLASLAGFSGLIFLVQTNPVPVVAASSLVLLAGLHFSSKAVDCKECRVKAGLEKTKK
ncbi:MAG: hypothetical protein Q8P02_03535 [Candidatus Micrarchaeota archaeon]|nr:hypothetical protein [Candidatus Micrarchaeota archaeon]